MYEESAVLLRKIYRSSKTAIDAMGEISKKSGSFDFERFLEVQQHKYFDIAQDANMQLRGLHRLPEEENPWTRIGFLTFLKLETIKNTATNHLSEILIEGCMGGVNEMIKEIHKGGDVEPQCLDLAHILIETEQETIAILQRFL